MQSECVNDKDVSTLRKGEKDMEIIVKAVTTIESYAEKRQEAQGNCDDVKCKLCEY